MKPEKYYFKYSDSEICYTEDHFRDEMIFDGLTEIEVYEAIPEKIAGIFWCKAQTFCGDDSHDSCGKQCHDYRPRNGKSGCCKFYTTKLYTHGTKTVLVLK